MELVVTITVAGIVAGMGAALIAQAGEAYACATSRSDAFADGDYALKRMALELANLQTSTNITSLGSDAITFNPGSGAVTFEKSGSQVLRNAKMLAEGVTAFSVTAYAADGTVTTTPALVRRLALAIRVSRNGLPTSLRTEVFPRAFRTAYTSWQEE